MINAGVIGYGYWGPNIVRNFHNHQNITIKTVADVSKGRLKLLKETFPDISATTDCNDILTDTAIDLVAVITPVKSHYELAKKALLNGKHIFVEKPFTANSEQAKELIDIAERKGLIIMVDHTFLFTSSVRKMKELVDSGSLGDLYYYDSVRVNLGILQNDINVIWDLAPHDLSIMNFILANKKPTSVNAVGVNYFGNGLVECAYLTVKFDHNFMGHFHVNWLSPVKVRKTLVAGNKKMLVWDDLEVDSKVKIYDKGVAVRKKTDMYDLMVQYRAGEMMYVPRLQNVEALKSETDYLSNCIEQSVKPINSGEQGLDIVRILEASDLSLKNGGKEIKLEGREY